MPAREMAQLLMRKAAQDAFTVRKLVDDPASPEEIIGFHAQQAVEKMLKAVLALRGIPYRKTHNLFEIIDLLSAHDIHLPEAIDGVEVLTPFAAEFRYDEFLPDPESTLDRSAVLRYIDATRAWAESQLE